MIEASMKGVSIGPPSPPGRRARQGPTRYTHQRLPEPSWATAGFSTSLGCPLDGAKEVVTSNRRT
jgi:hypothetical protein